MLNSLKQCSIAGSLPSAVKLPAACQLNLANLGVPWASRPLVPTLTQWLVRLQTDMCGNVQNESAPAILRQDIRLERLTLRIQAFGSYLSPFVISGKTCSLITQAAHVALWVQTFHLHVPRDTDLAWTRVRITATERLRILPDNTLLLLNIRALLHFVFLTSTLIDDLAEWQRLADSLGQHIGLIEGTCNSKTVLIMCCRAARPEQAELVGHYQFLKAGCFCQACTFCLRLHGVLP